MEQLLGMTAGSLETNIPSLCLQHSVIVPDNNTQDSSKHDFVCFSEPRIQMCMKGLKDDAKCGRSHFSLFQNRVAF